ncbi:hypothetical protein [Glutamicibacter ardleyensis]|uniref:hypothetical protein n=1 Tax=Glutamicibacter ardleyensis TaxID=225894 RepID=UPI003FD0FF4E
MNSQRWIESLRSSALKQKREFVQINFALSAILVLLTVTVGLAIEETLKFEFGGRFWLCLLGSVILLLFLWWTWKVRETKSGARNTLVHISIDQLGASGWEHTGLPKDVVHSFAPIHRHYRATNGLATRECGINLGQQLRSVATSVESLAYSSHGMNLSIIPVGHFPAMFGLGYRSQFPPGTKILEQIKDLPFEGKIERGLHELKMKTASRRNFASSEFISCLLEDISQISPSTLSFSKSLQEGITAFADKNVKNVWCEIALVNDPRIRDWGHSLEHSGPKDRRSADLYVRGGFFSDLYDNDADFMPVEIINGSARRDQGAQVSQNLSVGEAACYIVDTMSALLARFPDAQINMVVRAPRIVYVAAGALFRTRTSSYALTVPMDPWDRLVLWGPVYAETRWEPGYPRNDSARDQIVSIVPFNIVDDL